MKIDASMLRAVGKRAEWNNLHSNYSKKTKLENFIYDTRL